MKKIVKKTIKISKEYLIDCGFNRQRVDDMLQISIQDINKIIKSLENLLKDNILNEKEIKKQLHALKGLVAQLNNIKLAKKITKIEKNINREDLEKLLNE